MGIELDLGLQAALALSYRHTYVLPVRRGLLWGKKVLSLPYPSPRWACVLWRCFLLGKWKEDPFTQIKETIFAVLLLNLPPDLDTSQEQRLSVLFTLHSGPNAVLQVGGTHQCPRDGTWTLCGSEAKVCCFHIPLCRLGSTLPSLNPTTPLGDG